MKSRGAEKGGEEGSTNACLLPGGREKWVDDTYRRRPGVNIRISYDTFYLCPVKIGAETCACAVS